MKKISLIILTILVISCNSKSVEKSIVKEKLEQKKIVETKGKTILNDTVIYQSYPNGMAEIILKIYPNNSFNYYMRIIPQPMDDDEESIINSKGTWIINNNWVRLQYANDEISLESIFNQNDVDKNPNNVDKNQFKLIDKRTVDLNIELNNIILWGILCEKITD